MNDHIDLIWWQIEKPAGFDDFQGLVHHGGRIDCDFWPHPPGGVRQGVLHGDILHLLSRIPPEWAATGREYDSLQVLPPPARQGLKDGTMFAIDWENFGLPASGHFHAQRPRHDECL